VDGIHDMGGMHGFGPVGPTADEPVFHEPWEGRTFGLMVATSARGLRAGSIRPAIETIDPATYLASSYYERWARGVEAQLVAGGSLTVDAIDERVAAGGELVRSRATDPDLVAALPAFLNGRVEPSGAPVTGAFTVGDRVTVARMAPSSHHRCPRYVRGVTGTVARLAGGWPPPGHDDIEAIYTVRFAMRDLWGDDAEPGHLFIDLWERYLS
jgi:nitrile hydratase